MTPSNFKKLVQHTITSTTYTFSSNQTKMTDFYIIVKSVMQHEKKLQTVKQNEYNYDTTALLFCLIKEWVAIVRILAGSVLLYPGKAGW